MLLLHWVADGSTALSPLMKPHSRNQLQPMQCTMCTLDSFFSFRPSAVGHIVQPRDCHIIEHIFVPTHSVERNNEKIRFPWASNSKFVIFPQIFPCSNYKICPIMPLLFPVSNGDSPVSTTFPRSNYRGFFTKGESYCIMYTLCIVHLISLAHVSWSRFFCDKKKQKNCMRGSFKDVLLILKTLTFKSGTSIRKSYRTFHT